MGEFFKPVFKSRREFVNAIEVLDTMLRCRANEDPEIFNWGDNVSYELCGELPKVCLVGLAALVASLPFDFQDAIFGGNFSAMTVVGVFCRMVAPWMTLTSLLAMLILCFRRAGVRRPIFLYTEKNLRKIWARTERVMREVLALEAKQLAENTAKVMEAEECALNAC